jgi:CBS domain-containing protein
MDVHAPVIEAGLSLTEVVAIVGNTKSSCYPVLDAEKKLVGTITLDGIRNTFANAELNRWLIALDIVEPVIATLVPQTLLADALEESERLDLEQIPVVTGDNTYAGILDTRAVRRRLSAEVLSRQQKADTMHMLQSA